MAAARRTWHSKQQREMASLTYDLGLNTADQDDTPDTTPGRTTPYVPAAPGVDPKSKPRHSPATSCRPARPHLSACNLRGSGRNEVAVRVEPSSVAA